MHGVGCRLPSHASVKRDPPGHVLEPHLLTSYHNRWFDHCHDVYKLVSLLFLWLNRIPWSSAREAAQCSQKTAVDAYSMAREICEVIMSHEVTSRRFGGSGIEVEVDECFLTRRKYHKGRRMQTGSVTLFGIYERATDLIFHVRVRDRSNAVLLSEIERFTIMKNIY